jgi:hypothetical protein
MFVLCRSTFNSGTAERDGLLYSDGFGRSSIGLWQEDQS